MLSQNFPALGFMHSSRYRCGRSRKGDRAKGIVIHKMQTQTWRLSVGSFCLKMMSQTSSVPSSLVVKNTAGRVGLQHPSVRYDMWYLRFNKGAYQRRGQQTTSRDHLISCRRFDWQGEVLLCCGWLGKGEGHDDDDSFRPFCLLSNGFAFWPC